MLEKKNWLIINLFILISPKASGCGIENEANGETICFNLVVQCNMLNEKLLKLRTFHPTDE